MTPPVFAPIDPAEVRVLTFDFTNLLAGSSLTGTPVCTVAMDQGDGDGVPIAIVTSAAAISGAVVQVGVTGGSDGATFADYHVDVACPCTDGRVLVLGGILPVRKK